MPAPSNTSALTAVDLGTLPASVTQTVDDAGTTYTVWYRYTAVADDHVIGLWGFGDLAVYKPSVKVYLGPAAAPVQYLDGFNTENKRIQIPVEEGETYYFEFTPNAGDPSPAELSLTALKAPQEANAPGSIFVNDDSVGYPAVIIDPDGGGVLNFINPFPAGEAADILNDGTILAEDIDLTRLQVFDLAFAPVATLDLGSGSPRIRANHGANNFYVGTQTNPVTVRTVTAAGAFGPDTFTLTGITSLLSLAASNDEAILYHATTATGSAIHRWDLPGNGALSDLAAGIALHFVPDILVLSDDTIIALFVRQFIGTIVIRHYDTDGTQLHEYAIADESNLPFGTLPRLAYAIANPDSFWVWWHPLDESSDPTGISRFQEIQVSDGTVLRTVESVEYELGIYEPPVTDDPLAEFGNSFSCPFFILRGATPVGTLIVQKVLQSGDSEVLFPISVGGLSPSGLTLSDGESHLYENVPVGSGYSVSETPPPGYVLVEIQVSNDSPSDNISMAEDEVVMVLVINRLAPPAPTPISPCQTTPCEPVRGGPREGA